MTSSFYLICFGILGCYAGMRTVRAGWAKGLIAIVLIACLIHLGFDSLFSRQQKADQVAASTLHAPAEGGMGGYMRDKMADLEADRCVLGHLRETPLSPIAYVIELHSFLAGYKKLQAAQMAGAGNPNLGQLSGLLVGSFGDTAGTLSPEEVAAVKEGGGSHIESLCNAFGKWTGMLAMRPVAEQKQVWDSFQSSIDDGQ